MESANSDAKLSDGGADSVAVAPSQLPSRAGLYMDGRFVDISPDLYAELAREANENGISIEQAYREELEAQRKLEALTPSLEEVLAMARRGGAPDYMKNT